MRYALTMSTHGTKPATFADRLKAAARLREWSQAEIARRLGVTRGAVTHWYSGRSEPAGATLALLADSLGVSARWLVSGVGEERPHAAAPAPAAAPRGRPSLAGDVEAAMLEAFRALTPDAQIALTLMVGELAERASDAEILDVQMVAATRGIGALIRRDAVAMIRAWLTLSERDRADHKRRVETDALRARAPSESDPFPTAPAAKVPRTS